MPNGYYPKPNSYDEFAHDINSEGTINPAGVQLKLRISKPKLFNTVEELKNALNLKK